jgi:hypothetical protein
MKWALVPTRTPRIFRNCPKCGKKRGFVCSEKFRVNAQKKKLDVWLIYRCEVCESTLNVEIVERQNPRSIAPELLQEFMQNSTERALACAFDFRRLIKQNLEVERDVPFDIVKVPDPEPDAETLTIRVVPQRPLFGRLDRILSAGLDLSRAHIKRLAEVGRIAISPPTMSLDRQELLADEVVLLLPGTDLPQNEPAEPQP